MTANPKTTEVEFTHPKHYRMVDEWRPILDLLGGTRAMRSAGERWITKEDREPDASYARRVSGATLFSAFEDAVERIVSKPFSRPISVEELPPKLAFIERDADRSGSSLTSIVAEWMTQAVAFGMSHVLVDYPDTRSLPRGGDETPSIAAVRERNVRAYARVIHPKDLFFWRGRQTGKGQDEVPIEVRIHERIEVEDGLFGLKEIDQIRRITETTVEVWRKKETQPGVFDGTWEQSDAFPNPVGRVPIVTLYTKKTGFMTADPPLKHLAWQNVKHFSLDADHRHSLRVAGFAFLYQRGMTEEEIDEDLVVGPFRVIRTTAKPDEADLGFIEHSGKAIEAIERGLKATEDRMEILGMRPFLETSRTQTATAKGADVQEDETQAQQWVRRAESATRRMIELFGAWERVTIPDALEVKIFNEFGVSNRSPAELDFLGKLHERGAIPDDVMLNETKRRGVLSADVDIDDAIERAKSEHAERVAMMLPMAEPGDDEGDEDEDDEIGGDPTASRRPGARPGARPGTRQNDDA